jgi:hypothetical protein
MSGNIPSNIADKAIGQVVQKHPVFQGIKPQITPHGNNQWLMIFKKDQTASNGKVIPLTLRVVVNDKGSLVKVSMSK